MWDRLGYIHLTSGLKTQLQQKLLLTLWVISEKFIWNRAGMTNIQLCDTSSEVLVVYLLYVFSQSPNEIEMFCWMILISWYSPYVTQKLKQMNVTICDFFCIFISSMRHLKIFGFGEHSICSKGCPGLCPNHSKIEIFICFWPFKSRFINYLLMVI